MQEIQALMNNASSTLKDLESKIRETIETPEYNINSNDYQLINIPDKYIRTASFFRDKYKLNELIENKHERDNIAYSLQLSDLYNYFMNRFNIFLSVGVFFRKQALINIVSIQEGILKCTYNSLRKKCIDENGVVCKYNSKCNYYLQSLNNIRNNGLLDNYQNVIKFYDESLFQMLKEQKGIRDRIHIHDIDTNELFNNEAYTKEKYNQSVLVLQFLKIHLPDSIERFTEERNKNCKKITVCNLQYYSSDGNV